MIAVLTAQLPSMTTCLVVHMTGLVTLGVCKQEGGRQKTPAYRLSTLQPGHNIKGPAILLDDISTVVVEPRCLAQITASGDVRIDVKDAVGDKGINAEECDPIQLAIFSHRCCSTDAATASAFSHGCGGAPALPFCCKSL